MSALQLQASSVSGAPARPGGSACVYLLARRDRARFKIGWSHRPWLRARELPECSPGELDLQASRLIWLPGRQWARQVEHRLHRQLATHRVWPGHHRDGASEWFDARVQHHALRLLANTPLSEGGDNLARLRPLHSPLPGSIVPRPRTTARQTWHWLEELLSRIGQHCPASLDADEPWVLRLQGLRACGEPGLPALRRGLQEAATRPVSLVGAERGFVQRMAWRGDDLELVFAPLAGLHRATGDEVLAHRVRSFLTRLCRLQPGSGGAGGDLLGQAYGRLTG